MAAHLILTRMKKERNNCVRRFAGGMKLFIAIDNFCNDGLLMSVSQEGGFRCDTVITEFIPTNINCYVCLTLELYYIYVLIYSLSLLFPLIDEKAQFIA